jgi:hypothetical protein
MKMLKAKFIVTFWKLAVILTAIITINWLMLVTNQWLLYFLFYASTGLVIRSAFGRMIPTRPDGQPLDPQKSTQDYIAVEVIEFCNRYAFPLLWPIILLFLTLNPFRAEE